MTNFEKIKNMTIDEMAEFLTRKVFERDYEIPSMDCFFCEETHCIRCIKQWLEREVEENDGKTV
jgi:hypothetical protein